MSKQTCIALTTRNTQCSRNALYESLLCRMHDDRKKAGYKVNICGAERTQHTKGKKRTYTSIDGDNRDLAKEYERLFGSKHVKVTEQIASKVTENEENITFTYDGKFMSLKDLDMNTDYKCQ